MAQLYGSPVEGTPSPNPVMSTGVDVHRQGRSPTPTQGHSVMQMPGNYLQQSSVSPVNMKPGTALNVQFSSGPMGPATSVINTGTYWTQSIFSHF